MKEFDEIYFDQHFFENVEKGFRIGKVKWEFEKFWRLFRCKTTTRINLTKFVILLLALGAILTLWKSLVSNWSNQLQAHDQFTTLFNFSQLNDIFIPLAQVMDQLYHEIESNGGFFSVLDRSLCHTIYLGSIKLNGIQYTIKVSYDKTLSYIS